MIRLCLSVVYPKYGSTIPGGPSMGVRSLGAQVWEYDHWGPKYGSTIPGGPSMGSTIPGGPSMGSTIPGGPSMGSTIPGGTLRDVQISIIRESSENITGWRLLREGGRFCHSLEGWGGGHPDFANLLRVVRR